MSVERSIHIQHGKIYLLTENDGATFLRRGAEPQEEIVTLEELRSISKRLYDQAKAEFEGK